jgi:hypothetical protein
MCYKVSSSWILIKYTDSCVGSRSKIAISFILYTFLKISTETRNNVRRLHLNHTEIYPGGDKHVYCKNRNWKLILVRVFLFYFIFFMKCLPIFAVFLPGSFSSSKCMGMICKKLLLSYKKRLFFMLQHRDLCSRRLTVKPAKELADG